MIEPSQFVSNPTGEQAKLNMTRPKLDIPDINMTEEQAKDDFLQSVRSQLSNNSDPPKSVSKYLLLDDVLYYVSEDEVLDEFYLRLCIPSHMCDIVLKQYHDLLGHMGTDRCYSSMNKNISGKICIGMWLHTYLNVSRAMHEQRNLKRRL